MQPVLNPCSSKYQYANAYIFLQAIGQTSKHKKPEQVDLDFYSLHYIRFISNLSYSPHQFVKATLIACEPVL